MFSILSLLACVPKSADTHPVADSQTDAATDSATDSSVGDTDSLDSRILDSDSAGRDTHTDIDSPDSDSRADSHPPDSDSVDTVGDSADSGDPDTGELLREMEWVLIPASTFEMGCTAGQGTYCDSDETVHDVTLTRDYYVLSTEVTQAWYEDLAGENPSDDDGCGPNCPVEQVSWHDAANFANLLSDSEGLEECYTCDGGDPPFCEPTDDVYGCSGYRLLTEAEWEGAARCGTDLLYSGSDSADDVAWYITNSHSDIQPVAGLLPNACGLYDMSGNVFEWAEDVKGGDYGPESATDPVDETDPPTTRVGRGGGWRWSAEYSRVAERYSGYPWASSSEIGFRLARTAP